MATNGEVKSEQQLDEKIMKQIEYYFGDINLPRDKFLQEEMKKDDGWVSLTTMLKFNRLAALSTDLDQITSALKDSHLIDVSDDNVKIRRNPEEPLPENTLEYWQEIKRRTVYLKGFPQESTLDEIAKFVGKFGEVKNILMRKTRGSKETPKVFKGSVFATFVDQEQAKKLASVKDLKFKDEYAMVNKMQEDYWAEKNNERRQQRELKKQMRKETIDKQNQSHFVKGLVLKLSGLPMQSGETKKEVSVHKLKEFFEPYGQPAYAVIEGSEATLRFGGSEENAAQEAWQKAVAAAEGGKVMMDGSEITAVLLEGEQEAQYWTEFTKSKVEKQQRMKQGKAKGKSGKFDQQQQARRNRKRGHEQKQDEEGRKAKRTVFKDEAEEEEEVGGGTNGKGSGKAVEANGAKKTEE
ncbi:hypothetical protein niasHS_017755 [Heterodera schachtii]|uniref:Uncharacterized protein n=1 Tax=Heterodera schachtii TaxID=97005 RepID=A0ABD2I137_HETSC